MIYDRPTMICENLSPDDNIHFFVILHLQTDITDYQTHFFIKYKAILLALSDLISLFRGWM